MLHQITASSFLLSVLGNDTDTDDSSPATSDFDTTAFETDRRVDQMYNPFDNPSNLISAATRKKLNLVLDYVYMLFLIIGVPANVLNCLVFYRQGLRDRMNLCLCWLAVTDLCYLVSLASTSTIATLVELGHPEFFRRYEAYSRLYLSSFISSFLTTSACTTMVIAVERCVCVLFPLKAQTLISSRTMAVLLLTITLLLHLGFATFLFRYRVQEIVNTQTGQSLWILMPAPGPDQDLISRVFHVVYNLMLLFTMNLVAVAVVVICTVITVIKVRKALVWRLATTRPASVDAQSQQIALTKMLVVVCCIYVTCSFPNSVMALLRRIIPEYSLSGKYANVLLLTLIIVFQVFAAINTSVNFFVYYWMSSRFRQELRFLCIIKDKNMVTGVKKR